MTTKIPAELWARVDGVRGRLSRRQWIALMVEEDQLSGVSRGPRRDFHAKGANAQRAAKAEADTEEAGADLVAFYERQAEVGLAEHWRQCPRLVELGDRAYQRAAELLIREGALVRVGRGYRLAEPSEPGGCL